MPQESSKAYKSYWLMRAGCRHIIGINFNWEMTQKNVIAWLPESGTVYFSASGVPAFAFLCFT